MVSLEDGYIYIFQLKDLYIDQALSRGTARTPRGSSEGKAHRRQWHWKRWDAFEVSTRVIAAEGWSIKQIRPVKQSLRYVVTTILKCINYVRICKFFLWTCCVRFLLHCHVSIAGPSTLSSGEHTAATRKASYRLFINTNLIVFAGAQSPIQSRLWP